MTGVSWYEAAAYCSFRDARLPTLFEWEKAARDGTIASYESVFMPWGFLERTRAGQARANFSGEGTTPVDAHPFGISPYGAYDMAGNAKEWLQNSTEGGRAVTGGSWEDPVYLFAEVGSQDPLSSSPSVGFRCARRTGWPGARASGQGDDLRMGLDYLETRDDVDMDALAYVALSWGAGSRLGFAAVDDRFRAVIFVGGGIDERVQPTLPEASNVNFAPRIEAPTLLLNGREDEEHPWITRALPLWNLLSEPKELVLVEGAGHVPPPEARVPAMLDFLDRHLGPAR